MMKAKEFEKKILVSKTTYSLISTCFGDRSNRILQINYYYDTEEGYFRSNRTTCRIRQKDQELLGTLKRHGVGENTDCSMEERFAVQALPYGFEVDNRRVLLQGVLITDRQEVKVCDGVCLVLDKNTYLGETDYEIEVEYTKDKAQIAEGMMVMLENLIGITRSDSTSQSKADRFFHKMSQMGGNWKRYLKRVSYDPDSYIKTAF